MNELFETVLILSLFGFGITALLLLLKPVTVKKFPAKWQYYVWIAVLISMIIPIYKFIPKQEVQKLSFVTRNEVVRQENIQHTQNILTQNLEETENTTDINDKTSTPSIPEILQKNTAKMMGIFSYIWLIGILIYILVVIISYAAYILCKRKNSFMIADNPVFESTKTELGIKRNIRLKISKDILSPMLVGMIFPTIYIPAKDISDENMRMIFLHELTHYKRGDLLIKWLALFVNAVHWFNPLAYLLCANISESCEISCDMAVTHNMPDNQQKVYMKTILDLAE